MKKNDWLIITATAAYSYLFYNQSAGLNFFIFNLILTLLLLLSNRQLLYQPCWLFAWTGSLVSSFFVLWWGTELPVYANICSLLALVGFSFHPESSFLVAAFNSCYSTIAAIPRALMRSVSPNQQDPAESSGS